MTYETRSLIGACLCVVAADAFAANFANCSNLTKGATPHSYLTATDTVSGDFASDNLGSGKSHRVKSGKSFRLCHGSGNVLLLK